jgi:pimeloyl-ACP methyl ester carboxylesterase
MVQETPQPAERRSMLRMKDLQGLSSLVVDGVVGVVDVVEAMHQSIAQRTGLQRLLPPSARSLSVSSLVYRSVRASTRLVGRSIDTLCGMVPSNAEDLAPQREGFVAALNGVWGDHLAATGNPLAIPMTFRVGGRALDASTSKATGRIVVLVHGLAMNDLQWTRNGHDHGQALARDAGFTPVHLHYNSGLHISQNGAAFSALLDDLVAHWPVPVQELVIVGHSMGGLVARSACHVGEDRPWRRALTALVCLGTPHHGAPLERIGQLAVAMLGLSPYAAPLAKLGQARSAGITDLRFGNVQDADWQPHPHHGAQSRDATLRACTPQPLATVSFHWPVHWAITPTSSWPCGCHPAIAKWSRRRTTGICSAIRGYICS